MKSALIILLCFFAYSYVVLSYEDSDDAPVPNTVCSDLKIRVEIGGHFLEFPREDVNIYSKVSDKKSQLSQRVDLSQDCNVNTIKNVTSVFIDFPKTSMKLSFSEHQKSLYSEYYARGDLKEYERTLSELNGRVTKLFYADRKALIILNDTSGVEKNASPILFVCQGYLGCTTSYIHPSGLKLSYTMGDYRDFEEHINRAVMKKNKEIESFFISIRQ